MKKRDVPEPAVPKTEARVARRERRRERSREEIIAAARAVLLRNGVAGATLDAIAEEAGLTKAAIYYYYPSKDALFFEVIFQGVVRQSQAVHDAVEKASGGAEALRAIIGETIRAYAGNMDDFRLLYVHSQLAKPGEGRVTPEQLSRVRPYNDVAFAGATKLLQEDWKQARGRARVEPRMMAFLANLAAVGVLTMKGMVESIGDPLLYSDEQLIDALARIFAAAAEP